MSATGFSELEPSWLRAKQGVKWSRSGPGVLPAWVADMDYPVAPPVRAAIQEVLDRGDLCYPAWSNWVGVNPLAEPFAERMAERYGWHPKPGLLRNLSDILQALQIVLELTTRPGDAVALHTPSYPPFIRTIEMMGRRIVASPVERTAAGWTFDPQRLEEAVRATGCRVLMLVNPHNPTGRVLTAAELLALAGIVLRNDMLVVSDEVLSDLVHTPHRHIPFASLGPEAAARTVTLNSATKAFNISGMRVAVAHFGPAELRAAFDAHPPDFFGPVDVLSVEATKAAWRDGAQWLAELMDYLRGNRDLIAARLAADLPGIAFDPPEAGYLAWLDCRRLGLPGDPAEHFLTEARVRLAPGTDFGPPGRGFARLNFGTSAALVERMLDRMSGSLGLNPSQPSEKTIAF